MSIRDNYYIYHLTAFENMRSILLDGLLPRKQLQEQENAFTDVADPQIMAYRKENYLDEYVPFHFFRNSPFAGRVMRDHPGKYVYIAVNREYAKTHDFKIIPNHPMSSFEKNHIQMCTYAEGFELIDWKTMDERDYHDNYCKEVCMSECLCKGKLDIHQLICDGNSKSYKDVSFFVKSEDDKRQLIRLYDQLFPDDNVGLRIIVPDFF